jgi:membrane protease YdiL (CAAX protease family)
MIGIIVQLAISGIVVWVMERKTLSILGFYPSQQRIKYFFIFLIITAIGCASGFLLKFLIAKQQWILNAQLSPSLLLNGIWFTIKSVLFEELIFRGALLYILIQRMGKHKAVFISAVAFGIYHWFTYEVLGNPLAMLMVWVVTAAMGWVLAYGYARTW